MTTRSSGGICAVFGVLPEGPLVRERAEETATRSGRVVSRTELDMKIPGDRGVEEGRTEEEGGQEAASWCGDRVQIELLGENKANQRPTKSAVHAKREHC